MARAILALKFGQWHYLRARMAQAILALPTIFECHNGLSHSGTQVMQLAVSECLEPFLHSSRPTVPCQNGLSHSSTQVMALKYLRVCSHSGPVSCTLLVCMNGSSHSGIANNISVLEWLEPFYSTAGITCVQERLEHSNMVGSARMARAIMALKYGSQCQNGSSHSCTQVMPCTGRT